MMTDIQGKGTEIFHGLTRESEFSGYKNPITNTIPLPGPLTVLKVHQVILSDRLKEKTDQVRGEPDKDRRSKLKRDLLPYVTFSGIFTQRSDSDLQRHSGLICIDLDHLRCDLMELQRQVIEAYKPALLFRSPSGDGLKIIYSINVTKASHKDYFKALETMFKWDFDIDVDQAAKDVSRACFLCHDPDAFTTDNPDTLDPSFIETYTPGNVFSNAKEYLRRRGISFTDGSRNDYAMQYAAYCHRAGLPAEEVEAELLKMEEPGFPVSEIRGIIQSIYKNSAYTGIASEREEPPKKKKRRATPIPPFPVEVFPAYLQSLIDECVSVYGTPVDFWAGSFLTAISTAVGNSMILDDGKYKNNPALWFGFVGATGTGKTQPLAFALHPFHDLDRESFKQYEAQKSLFDSYKAASKKERDEMQQQDPPVLIQHVISDFTPEAMGQVHRDNPRGIIVHRDELMGWINDFERYNKSGEVQNWLSIWSGQTVTYNRKSQAPVKLSQPCIGIAGGIQPELLKQLGADHRTDNGLMQRFCFCYPDHASRPQYSTRELSIQSQSNYSRFINTLLSLPMDEARLSLTAEGREAYRQFVNTNAVMIDDEQSDYIRGIYAKLDIIVLRLAIILHVAEAATTGELDPALGEKTIHGAIQIAEYFRQTALKVFDHFSTNTGITKQAIIRYLHDEVGNKNQSDIARTMGVTHQYVNKILNSN